MARKVSFVVAARNEPRQVLEATVAGLLETSAAHSREIVVVEDASDVPVSIDHREVLVIRNPDPIGTSQSRRKAAAASTGDVLVSVDAHMRFSPDWIEHMLAHVNSGALLCAAWWDYDLKRALCWGADFVWCGERDYAAGRCPGLGFRHRTTFPGEKAVDVPLAIGACYMVLRESYDRFGGFSPFFRTWGKLEQDLCARAWITGVGVKCVPGARVGHFSRPRFPYPVSWGDIEFNQVAMIRTVFQEATAQTIEQLLQPLPSEVQTWLSNTDFRDWRESIQVRRQMPDAEFFRRFVPGAPESLLRPPADFRR
jgi:hypothetical protein